MQWFYWLKSWLLVFGWMTWKKRKVTDPIAVVFGTAMIIAQNWQTPGVIFKMKNFLKQILSGRRRKNCQVQGGSGVFTAGAPKNAHTITLNYTTTFYETMKNINQINCNVKKKNWVPGVRARKHIVLFNECPRHNARCLLVLWKSDYLTTSLFEKLTILKTHHFKISPFQNLTISKSHHFKISPFQNLAISKSHHFKTSPF